MPLLQGLEFWKLDFYKIGNIVVDWQDTEICGMEYDFYDSARPVL